MWLNLAVTQSMGEDRQTRARMRDNIAQLMTSEQVAEAQRLALEWDAAHLRR